MSAGAELGSDQFAVGGGEAGDDARRGQTDVRAIQVGANAGDLPGDGFFTETSVGAGIAGFGTGVGSHDALDCTSMIRVRIEGMRLKHLFDVAHALHFAAPDDAACK